MKIRALKNIVNGAGELVGPGAIVTDLPELTAARYVAMGSAEEIEIETKVKTVGAEPTEKPAEDATDTKPAE